MTTEQNSPRWTRAGCICVFLLEETAIRLPNQIGGTPLVILYTMANGHLHKTASTLNSELHRNQTLVLQQPAADTRTEELRASIASLEEQLLERRIRVPDTPWEHPFSERLNELAQTSGLSVDELRPDQYFHSANMDHMTFQIRLSGE